MTALHGGLVLCKYNYSIILDWYVYSSVYLHCLQMLIFMHIAYIHT